MIELCPVQERALSGLRHALSLNPLAALFGDSGSGKTTVLRALEHETGARYLTLADLTLAMRTRHPLAIEETFEQIVLEALEQNPCVIIDDVDILEGVVSSGCGSYPRSQWLNAPAMTFPPADKVTYASANVSSVSFFCQPNISQ